MDNGLKSCPFCGGDMKEHISVVGLPMFKCENRDCGAIVSFDNDLCNIAATRGERGPARMAFNTRAERTCWNEMGYGFIPDEDTPAFKCSACGETHFCDSWYDYCPGCGAKVVE